MSHKRTLGLHVLKQGPFTKLTHTMGATKNSVSREIVGETVLNRMPFESSLMKYFLNLDGSFCLIILLCVYAM